jgi:hypothetical protein
MKRNFTLFFSLTLLIFSISISAQENIRIETFQRPYVPLEDGLNLTEGETWDDPDVIIPLALRSQFFDSDTNFYLYNIGTGGEVFVLTQQGLVKGLVPVAYDLIDRGYLDGENLSPLSANISGIPGDRILKLEWSNVGFYTELNENGVSDSYLNFQVWVYEGSPYIEYHYGPSDIQFDPETFLNGVKMLAAIITEYDLEDESMPIVLSVLEGNPANPTIKKITFTDEENFGSSGLDNYPTDSTVYRFYLGASSAKDFWANLSDITIQSNITSEYISLVSNDLNHDKNINVIITDINGKMCSAGNFRTLDQIDVRSLSSGQYFVKVQESGKSPKVLRFVKI